MHPPAPAPSPRYVPDYTKCIDHFALHAGGYAVLKGIQKGMNLPMEMMLPSFASLRDYGNTSSSTTWYSMSYLERFGMVKKGQRVMQVGWSTGGRGCQVEAAFLGCWRSALFALACAWAHDVGWPPGNRPGAFARGGEPRARAVGGPALWAAILAAPRRAPP
jgi:hypothetical protein